MACLREFMFVYSPCLQLILDSAIDTLCHLHHPEILCWFQTSLPLATLPLRRLIIACYFRVAALSGHAALALLPSSIAPELNRIQLSVAPELNRIQLSAKRQGYRSTGKTLLAAWSSLCGKWRLRSCTNIIIKVAMRQTAS